MARVIGLNEDAIDNVIMDIYDYADSFKEKINAIDSLISSSSAFYKDESASEYVNKFKSLSDTFSCYSENIISYAEDLIKLKSSIRSKDEAISDEINRASRNLED